ncbi:MAG: LptE family protein [Bacteroidales bacterium]|nr:LptE family protein [Bacteroidales bacterium]
MDKFDFMYKYLIIIFVSIFVTSCSIAYKFNGASIDYTKMKTVSISDFPIKTPLVYAPLSQTFTEGLRDIFQRQTRLRLIKQGGDLHFEGEISGYELTPQAVKENAFASETRLTVRVRVKFTNNADSKQNFDQSFTAYRDFPSTKMINEVQDQLIKEIVDEITDNIYNASVANW